MRSILLIEDDKFLADIYRTELQNNNFLVEVAVDGREGLKMIKDKNFDLIILDILLPYVDGWEILRKIKDDKLKTRVIVLSNLGEQEDIEKSSKLNVDKYLIKTQYTPGEVINEVKKSMGI